MQVVLINLACVFAVVTLLWLISVWRRDASLIDPYWGPGFVLLAWLSYALAGPRQPRALLVCVLATIWGLRLGGYLLWRNWGHAEDRRYAAMRDHHGPGFWWVSLFTVFWLQGILQWTIAFPLQWVPILDRPAPLGPIDLAGSILWLVGIYFETVGDWQLSLFRADAANRGKVLDQGLWRWTRHPNYFGDFCVWWGFYLLAVAGGAGWTIFSPLLMSFFLLRVSGVTLLEQDIADRRPAYRDYVRHTNAFFPGPRRRADENRNPPPAGV